MRFEASASNFLFGRLGWPGRQHFSRVRHGKRALAEPEQMEDSEILEQFRDAGVRVQQLNRRVAWFLLRTTHLETKSGQDTQEGAIHEHAVGKVEHKIGETS